MIQAENKLRCSSVHSLASTIKTIHNDVAKFRWIIFIIAHFVNFAVHSVGASLSLTIVVMIHHDNGNVSTESLSNYTGTRIQNVTESIGTSYTDWTPVDKDRMLQAFFWGGITTSIIGGRLGEVYGPRRVISFSLLCIGLVHLCFPIAALHSFTLAYIIRIIQGICVGLVTPTTFVVVSRWSTAYEQTLSNAVVYCGLGLANIVTHPLAGLLVSSKFLGGWPAVFYILGSLNIIIALIWYCMVYDHPEDHPYLSPEELETILTKRSFKSGVDLKVPWTKVLTSLPVIGFLVTVFTWNWLVAIIGTQIPSFYENVLKLNPKTNGYMASLPWIFSLIAILSGSFIADKIRELEIFSTGNIRKFFTLLGLGGGSLALFLVTIVGKENKIAIVTLVATSKGLGTLSMAGCGANHLDISPTFAGTLAGIGSMLTNLAALLANEGVAQIVGNYPTEQKWYQFFYLTIAVNFFGIIIFCLLGSGEVQKWDPSHHPNHTVTVSDKTYVTGKHENVEINGNSSFVPISQTLDHLTESDPLNEPIFL